MKLRPASVDVVRSLLVVEESRHLDLGSLPPRSGESSRRSAGAVPGRDVVIGISPFHRPDATLVAALCKAGALGVLDLSDGGVEDLQALARKTKANFGVRIAGRRRFDPADLPPEADVIILPAGVDPAPWQPRRILVQVTCAAEA